MPHDLVQSLNDGAEWVYRSAAGRALTNPIVTALVVTLAAVAAAAYAFASAQTPRRALLKTAITVFAVCAPVLALHRYALAEELQSAGSLASGERAYAAVRMQQDGAPVLPHIAQAAGGAAAPAAPRPNNVIADVVPLAALPMLMPAQAQASAMPAPMPMPAPAQAMPMPAQAMPMPAQAMPTQALPMPAQAMPAQAQAMPMPMPAAPPAAAQA